MDKVLPTASLPKSLMSTWWGRILLAVGRVALIWFGLLFILIMFFENKLIFFPTKYPVGNWDAPSQSEIPIEDVFFEASDGVKLHGWFARGKNSRATILYFHGNAGNLSDRYDWVCSLTTLPADVLILGYRGYGKSEGNPNEEGIYRDAEAAYRYLTETRGVKPERLVIYGKSIGGAPACELASRFPCAGLILQSTLTSASDMAGGMLVLYPAKWFIRTKFDNLGKIKKIKAPKLIVHSRDDEVIPFWMGERLYETASEPKTFKPFEGSGHNDLVWREGPKLLETFGEFLDKVVH